MKPQYQRSNQALKAYYKNTIPCQSNGGSQLKYRKKTDKQTNIHQINDLNKSNEDIDWLQKIVNGFQWYKDKQDPLFLDGDDNSQVKQYNYKREIQDKSINQICNKESVCLKSKGEYSQRVMDNKVVPSNNSNRSNQNNKSRQLKSEVFHKNSSFGKNIIAYRVKNKRSDSQNSIVSKKKECSISISQLTAKGQKVMDMQRERERQRERVRQEQKQRDRQKRQRQTNQKQIKKKNLDQTQKICDLIEVCGITDINNNILKMKTKLSMQEKNVKLNSKIASIKAERKNLRQVITQQKSNYGKIIKNKSVDLKQRSKTTNSVQNPYRQKQRYQVEDKYRPSLQKNSLINQKSQEKYLVQQFNEGQENAYKFKQNENRKAQTDSLKTSQTATNFNINNQIEKLMLRQRDPNRSILNTTQNQTQKQNKEYMENFHMKDKQNQNNSIRKQNENKKYYYLLEKNTQQRQQKIFAKKQRRLNSSFGQRKLIYNYHEQKPHQPLKKSNILLQNSNNECLKQNETKSRPTHVMNASEKKQSSYPQQLKKIEQKQQQDFLNKQNLEKQNQKKKILESSVYRNVKFVQSTKNSQVWTDHSMSIVLDKHLPNSMEENQNTPVKNEEILNQQWNILDIFSKLDCRKLGILSANNCSIQYVSREIRYILGPVLEQILYKNTKYNFTQFIQRVQNTLQHVKDSQLSVYQPQRYLKIKEWAPETQRVQQSRRKYDSNELAYKSSNTSNTLKQLSKSPQIQDSCVKQTLTKKYEYTKTFYEQVNTQPSVRMKKKQNKEVIRFATFQDQDMNQQENDGCFVFKNIEMSKSKTNGINQFEEEYSRISNQNMEQKLQKKLATLNLFQSTFGTGLQQKIQDDKLVKSIIKSRCRSDAEKTEYKNQIVKLQLLNQRLQRYLHDQTLKQYSTSKLLNGEI